MLPLSAITVYRSMSRPGSQTPQSVSGTEPRQAPSNSQADGGKHVYTETSNQIAGSCAPEMSKNKLISVDLDLRGTACTSASMVPLRPQQHPWYWGAAHRLE